MEKVMRVKTMLIYNPMSGKQTFESRIPEVMDRFERHGDDLDVYKTNHPNHATELAKQACEEGYERLVIVGGDGTFNECVNGLMHYEKRPLIGYIPAGTCCDIGNTLGLTKNINQVLDIIFNETPVHMDVVKANDRYFCYVTGIGAFVDISYVTDSKLKRRIGYLAYVLKALKELLTVPRMRMSVEYDDGVLEGKYSLMLVINSKRVAGVNMIYKPRLDDGLVDVVLYRSLFPFNGLIYLISFLLPFWSTPLVKRFKTSKLHVSTESKERWNIDGEPGGKGDQTMKVKKHAISIIVPKKTHKKHFKNQDGEKTP